ncbi:MAG: hypothetical protein E7623_02860 [Ruminococcaceae bacterium]|nr:hypothetical protein [Oscillospiraceae bacterium]
MKTLSRILSFILILSLLAGTFGMISVSAEPDDSLSNEESGTTVIKNVSSSAVFSAASFVVDDMSEGDISGYSGENGVPLSFADEITVDPYVPFSAEKCLKVGPVELTDGKWTGISKKVDTVVPVRNLNFIYSANCSYTGGKIYTKAVIHSAESRYETEAVIIEGGSWNNIIFDISMFSDISVYIDTIDIYFMVELEDGLSFNAEFYLDYMIFSNEEAPENLMRYMSGSFFARGGSLSYAENGMNISMRGQDPYIESYNIGTTHMSEANAIKVRMTNHTGCRSVKLYYTSEQNPVFSDIYSCTASINIGSAEQTCYFPVSAQDILQLRFVFEGSISGDIIIHSISPASAYVEDDLCEVTRFKISDDGRSIEMSGVLGSSYVSKYRNAQLCLLKVPMYSSVSDIGLSTVPVATAEMAESFRFEYTSDNIYSYINCAYVVVIKGEGSMIVLTGEKYVTNPEKLSNVSWEKDSTANKKGLAAESYFSEGEASHTLIDIAIEDIISFDVSEHSYYYEGTTYYYNADRINELDKALTAFYRDNAVVTAKIVLHKSGNPRLDSFLIYDSDTAEGKGAAWNIRDADGFRYIASALCFIADRYSSDSIAYGRIENYIIGNSVSDQWNEFYVGDMTLSSFVGLYAKTLRMSYNSIRSVSASADVYISLGNGWDKGLPAESTRVYDNRAFLDNLNACIIAGGNIAWNIAYDPYLAEPDYTAYSHKDIQTGSDADTVTVKNIDILYSYTNRSAYYHDGNYRSIILCEDEKKTSGSDASLAADFIYSYYIISSANYDRIRALIVNRDVNYEDSFKYADTVLADERCGYAHEILGVSRFADIYVAAIGSEKARRTVIEKSFDFIHPSGTLGNISIFDISSSGLGGWYAKDKSGSLRYESQYMGYENLMRFDMPSDGTGEGYIVCVPEYKLDLTSTPYLQMYVQLVSMPENVYSAEIALRIYSGRNYVESMSYIQKGEWVNLIFPISDFDYVGSVDKMEIKIASADGSYIGEPTVFISEIVGISDKYTSEELINIFNEMQSSGEHEEVPREIDMRLVWILIMVIIVTLTMWTVSILTRIRKKENE